MLDRIISFWETYLFSHFHKIIIKAMKPNFLTTVKNYTYFGLNYPKKCLVDYARRKPSPTLIGCAWQKLSPTLIGVRDKSHPLVGWSRAIGAIPCTGWLPLTVLVMGDGDPRQWEWWRWSPTPMWMELNALIVMFWFLCRTLNNIIEYIQHT